MIRILKEQTCRENEGKKMERDEKYLLPHQKNSRL